ncbi:MAG: hypothetical protein PVJ02_06300 [Gemmatimonadota bacterium]|jgi:hypothetical protein
MNVAVHPRALLLLCATAVVLCGCDLVTRYMREPPGDRLARAALAHWATPGRPFLEGASGHDTVASVNATGARAWEVAVVPPTAGPPSVWSFEVTDVEIYPVFPGEAFTDWLEGRAKALGMHSSLPAELEGALKDGRIEGVGSLAIRYGLADRTARNVQRRMAYLEASGQSGQPGWRIQPASMAASVLRLMLETVADDMVHHDERVQSCMGNPSPREVPRSKQLDCIAQVLEQQFGPDP